MPLNEFSIGLLRAEGVGFVCSMCVRMHEGRDQGLQRCTGTEACRGPMGGSTFKEYKGPLTEAMFEISCFACGSEAMYKLKPKSFGGRVLGLCKGCRPLLEMVPKDKEAPPVEAGFQTRTT